MSLNSGHRCTNYRWTVYMLLVGNWLMVIATRKIRLPIHVETLKF